jgi:3-oxoacyl-[acyl-carrier protein] reductase
MDLGLQGKVALVTGGSRGLGRAICTGLAAEGAKVAINYLRTDPRVLVAELKNRFGVVTTAVRADVTKTAEVRTLFEQTEQALGPVDILINNAGTWPRAYVQDMTDEQWDSTLAMNLTSAFLASREAVRRWLAAGRRGRIVNITISLAREMAPYGIQVNAVAPGLIDTGMTAEALKHNWARYRERVPLDRVGQPAEIADAVVFLASERATYITGATLHVNGGMFMG